jgi:hypothetical protein
MTTRRCAVLVLALFGCRKSYTADVTAVNALVPAKDKYKLEFEPRDLTAGLHRQVTYTVPVPKGWRANDVGGAENGDSSIWLHSSCDAESCTPQDWNALIDHDLRLLDLQRDERGDHRRVVVAKPGALPRDWLAIKVYWWVDGATEYHACEATLGPGLQEAAAAFEKACELAVVHDR